MAEPRFAKQLGCKTSHYFLLIGSTDPRKNTARSIAAFARAMNIKTELKKKYSLLIVGPKIWRTQDIQEAKDRAEQSGCQIVDTGYVEDPALHRLVSESSAVLMPSRYEGFGVPISLAQAYDVPVVTCLNSSLAEVSQASAHYAAPFSVDEIAMAIISALEEGTLMLTKPPHIENLMGKTWDEYILELIEVILGNKKQTLKNPRRSVNPVGYLKSTIPLETPRFQDSGKMLRMRSR
jgi:glycosyltransferase involved in cell wall biosynthesis